MVCHGYFFAALVLASGSWAAAGVPARLAGQVLDPQGNPVGKARLQLLPLREWRCEVVSDQNGRFRFEEAAAGTYRLRAESAFFAAVEMEVTVKDGAESETTVQFREIASLRQAVTVVGASLPTIFTPDPAEHVVVHEQVLDANPGRLGVPVSIPGLPVETASGGIKAPQYFAPWSSGRSWRARCAVLSDWRFSLSEQFAC